MTYLGKKALDNDELKKVMSYFIGQKEADISLLPTVVIPMISVIQDRQYRIRTLLDSGSMTNWITRGVLKKLKYTTKGHDLLEVNTMTGKVQKRFQLVEVYYIYNKVVNGVTCYVHEEFTKYVTIKGLPDYIKKNSNISQEQLAKIVDPATHNVDHKDISLGIGMILCNSVVNKISSSDTVIKLKDLNLRLEPTIFGTTVSGEVPQSLRGSTNTFCAYNIVPRLVEKVKEPLFRTENIEDEQLKKNLHFLDCQESLGISSEEIHDNDKKAWEHFISTARRIKGKEFEVRMPFNNKIDMLKSNIRKAAGRTRSEQEEMLRTPLYMQAMCKAHQSFIDKDSVEVVDTTKTPEGPIYYMPFRGIMKLDSKTTECRICMDASSKQSASDVSLNQALYQGPNMVLNLAILLIKFMQGKYGVIADLEKAFLRILIAPQDRDVLRYFWFSNPCDKYSPLIIMRFKVVIFGSKASPFQLAAVLHVLIRDDCKDKYVKKALENSIYVDNIVHAEDDEEKLAKFYEVSRELFKNGNFNLRQWASNSKKVMKKAEEEDVAEKDSIIKVLGMYWDIDRDRYLYCTGFEWNGKFTKRSTLAFSCKVFDPLGILSPITTRNKVFLQSLWKHDLKWDESFEFLIEGELKLKWLHLVRQTHIAMKCFFTRRTIISEKREVHVFSDASQDSYGAVAYIRTLPCPEFPQGHIKLVTAKGKVAPLKGMRTIPKLELAAVVVAAHMVIFVQKAWDIPKGTKYYLWTDAKVVCRWLGQFNIKETYVHNRVKQIRDLVDKDNTVLKHVPTEFNPADLLTKEQDAEKFSTNSAWFEGPSFLANENDWPTSEEDFELFPEGCDQKISLYKITVAENKETSVLEYFRNLEFALGLRVLAILKRVAMQKSLTAYKKHEIVSKEEIDKAKLLAIKIMQKEMFPKEVYALENNKKIDTKNRKFNLYLHNGVIKCKGRLGNLLHSEIENNPILVDGAHPFTQALIRYYHRHYNCSSKRYLLNKMKKFIHGPNVYKAVETVCRECYVCKLLRSQPYAYPKVPPLPEERLVSQTPFAVCGVDYSGPHEVRQGRGKAKVWIALFTCMVSRAIFIHIVPDLSAETFIAAYNALAWRHTQPLVLMSDNATCFTAANKILKELSEQVKVKDDLNVKGTTWIFTPTNAPWFGAVYERMIGTLKRELAKMLGYTVLTYFELDLHLKEVMGIINNRPLTVDNSNEVISPNNILTGSNNTDNNILEVKDTQEILKQAMIEKNRLPQLFKNAEAKREIFWKRFQEQYLEAIKFDNKPSQQKPGMMPQEGDVVIIYSKEHPKLQWRKGIILELLKSDDGQVRKAKIRTSTTETVKALNHLYPLEAKVEEAIEEYHRNKKINTFEFEGFTQSEQLNNKNRVETLRKIRLHQSQTQ